jgi:hypothetical protein
MSIYLAFVPDRAEPFEGADREESRRLPATSGPDGDPDEPLRQAYAARVERYLKELEEATQRSVRYRMDRAQSSFPEARLRLDGEEVTLVVDERLYTSLFDLYVFYGWDGIRAAEDALVAQFRDDLPARAALWFFYFTRNLLAILIQNALVTIEARASESLVRRVGDVARMVADGYVGRLKVKRTPERIQRVGNSDVWVKVPASYRIGNRPLADALYTAMHDAVGKRVAYEKLVERLAGLKEDIAKADQDAINESGPGWRSPDSKESAAERGRRLRTDQEQVNDDLELAVRKLGQAKEQLGSKEPLSLLVFPGLPERFGAEDMENALGSALWIIYEQTDALAKALRPGTTRISNDMSRLKGPPTREAIEQLYGPNFRLEHGLVSAAFFGLSEDPGYLAMLSTDTLHGLVASERIRKDSFDYVVYYHWVTAVERYQEEAAGRELFVGKLAKVAAALSLLSLVLPILTGATLLVGLALLCHSVHSMTVHLGQLDRALLERLVAQQHAPIEGLARAGELMVLREEFKAQMTTQMVIELATLGLSQWKLFRPVIHARSYYLDVQALTENGDTQAQSTQG